eukprot:7845534-Lingulodinium_polyedra.AAC.1
MAYRVWAAGRARDMATWVSTWSSGNPNRSAAELAWELAVELEATAAIAHRACARGRLGTELRHTARTRAGGLCAARDAGALGNARRARGEARQSPNVRRRSDDAAPGATGG